MTALNEFGLSDWTMGDLRSVFRQHPKVRKVILFGSREGQLPYALRHRPDVGGL